MAVNLATKYADKVAERFSRSSITAGAFNDEFKFNGVKGVTVYSVDTAPLSNYNREGTSRYGTPADLGDSIQELVLTQDKSFTYTIDKGNDNEQMNVKSAAKSLKRQIDEVISPYLDKYRLETWCKKAGNIVAHDTLTSDNIVSQILDSTAVLENALVPDSGRTLFISAAYYRLLKQNPEFISVEKLGEAALEKGVIGHIDGMKVVKVPTSWLPNGVRWLITHSSAVLAPAKLQDYKIHTDPPGINGNLVEGRLIHDAFVISAKADGVYCAVDESIATNAPVINNKAMNSAYSVTCSTSGASIYYTTDGSDPRYSATAAPYSGEISYSGWKNGTVLSAYAIKNGAYQSPKTTVVYGV